MNRNVRLAEMTADRMGHRRSFFRLSGHRCDAEQIDIGTGQQIAEGKRIVDIASNIRI